MSNVIFPKGLSDMSDTLWANGIYNRQDIEWYTKFCRLGIKDPYNAPTGSKEYLFFTKPDLNLIRPYSGIIDSINMNPQLSNQPYFKELIERYPGVITQLQSSWSRDDSNPFMAVLSNSLKNTLDLPAIESDVIETSETIYGSAYNYRGWGYKSDEKLSFSLEFEDTKYLEIYNLVKAYEEYERLKHMGMVTPPNIDKPEETGIYMNYYIKNKVLHDQFSIYKFIVEDDGETILYYAKLWGVFIKNVPRDTFSEMKIEGGLTYAVEFEAAFVDDMNPMILSDFNSLVYDKYKDKTVDLPIYNVEKRMIDGSWATIPMISKVKTSDINWNGPKNMKYIYKLKWRK